MKDVDKYLGPSDLETLRSFRDLMRLRSDEPGRWVGRAGLMIFANTTQRIISYLEKKHAGAGPPPPVAKYELVLKVTGNDHHEIERELYAYAHGGYLMDSKYSKSDHFTVYTGRTTRKLTHANPGQTAAKYDQELSAWGRRKGFRK